MPATPRARPAGSSSPAAAPQACRQPDRYRLPARTTGPTPCNSSIRRKTCKAAGGGPPAEPSPYAAATGADFYFLPVRLDVAFGFDLTVLLEAGRPAAALLLGVLDPPDDPLLLFAMFTAPRYWGNINRLY